MSNETIVVEAVSDKFKNKYNSGSVLAGGKWLQVSSKVPLNLFQKDTQVTVETKTNDKGYTSIVGVVEDEAPKVEAPKATRKTAKKEEAKPSGSYEENKNRRILVQGIVQAVLSSPGLINFGVSNVDDLMKYVEEISERTISFVEKNI